MLLQIKNQTEVLVVGPSFLTKFENKIFNLYLQLQVYLHFTLNNSSIRITIFSIRFSVKTNFPFNTGLTPMKVCVFFFSNSIKLYRRPLNLQNNLHYSFPLRLVNSWRASSKSFPDKFVCSIYSTHD